MDLARRYVCAKLDISRDATEAAELDARRAPEIRLLAANGKERLRRQNLSEPAELVALLQKGLDHK